MAGGECQVFNYIFNYLLTCFLKCFVVKSEKLDLSLSYQTESQYLTVNRDPEVTDSVCEKGHPRSSSVIIAIIIFLCGHTLTCLCVLSSIGGAPEEHLPVHVKRQSQASTVSDGHRETTSILFQKA